MDTKKRRKYEINFSIIFILGVFLVIYGLVLFPTGLEKNKKLKNIYTNETDISKLEEGDYIKSDVAYLLTRELVDKNLSGVAIVGYEDDSLLGATNYCMMKLNENTTEYMVLKIPFEFVNFEEWIDNGKCDFANPPDDLPESAKDLEFVLKVKEMDKNGREMIGYAQEKENLNEATYNRKIMFEIVDLDKERREFPASICLLISGIILVVVSDPRKIVSERYYSEEKEFNLIYADKTGKELEPNDIRVIEDVARTLRTEINYYENRYKVMKRNVRDSGIAVAVSVLIFALLPTVMLLLLIVIYAIKFLFDAAVISCNQNNDFSKSALSIFSQYPVKAKIFDCNVKLMKCEEVLSYVDVETILKSRYY